MTESVRPVDRGEYEYDVAFSFAGEDRGYVEEVAAILRDRGVRVFYDRYEEAELWGKDLYTHLDYIYGSAARYCVLFASASYASKLWTNHERESAQARAFEEHKEYILPARFDDTDIPGLRQTVGYQDLRTKQPPELADLIEKKLGPRRRTNYLPPVPDRLLEAMGVAEDDQAEQRKVILRARDFLDVLTRMSVDERTVVIALLKRACPAELPENLHINLDLLRRETGFPPEKIKKHLGDISSLGFTSTIGEGPPDDVAHTGHHPLAKGKELGGSEFVYVKWTDLSRPPWDRTNELIGQMIHVAQTRLCDEHAAKTLEQLNFGQLSSPTAVEDRHKPMNREQRRKAARQTKRPASQKRQRSQGRRK